MMVVCDEIEPEEDLPTSPIEFAQFLRMATKLNTS